MNTVIVHATVPLVYQTDSFSGIAQGPRNLAPHNITMNVHGEFECPLSKFLTVIPPSRLVQDLCIRLKLQTFWNHTRPWSCTANVILYPPGFYFQMFVQMIRS